MTRLDLTSEKLYSLDQTTLETSNTARENDRKVSVQAFVSRMCPANMSTPKSNLSDCCDNMTCTVAITSMFVYVDVAPNSSEEQEAQRLGIEPKDDRSEVGGRTVEQQVFMGALVSSSLGDVALPFIDGDTSIEYELSRSISTTTDKTRQLTVGILESRCAFWRTGN